MLSRWSRRDALKIGSTAGALALAGCLDLPVGYGAVPFPPIQLERDPVPEKWDVDIDATIVNQFSSRDPARLRIPLTNTADHDRDYWIGTLAPFTNIDGEHRSSDDRLLLYPVHPHPGVETYHLKEAPAAIPSRPMDGCWRPTDYVGIEIGPKQISLSPREELAETYAVLYHPDNNSCLADGAYRFEDTGITPTADAWGFTLFVSSPGDA